MLAGPTGTCSGFTGNPKERRSRPTDPRGKLGGVSDNGALMNAQAPRVLVVDDEENISFLVESALRLAGMETKSAGNEIGRAHV